MKDRTLRFYVFRDEGTFVAICLDAFGGGEGESPYAAMGAMAEAVLANIRAVLLSGASALRVPDTAEVSMYTRLWDGESVGESELLAAGQDGEPVGCGMLHLRDDAVTSAELRLLTLVGA